MLKRYTVFSFRQHLKVFQSKKQLIPKVEDISTKGFSSIMPFSIGIVEDRMAQFADTNGIELASNELYIDENLQRAYCQS